MGLTGEQMLNNLVKISQNTPLSKIDEGMLNAFDIAFSKKYEEAGLASSDTFIFVCYPEDTVLRDHVNLCFACNNFSEVEKIEVNKYLLNTKKYLSGKGCNLKNKKLANLLKDKNHIFQIRTNIVFVDNDYVVIDNFIRVPRNKFDKIVLRRKPNE